MRDYQTASWVIINKTTGKSVVEIYDSTLLCKINTRKYKAVPILEYLQQINKDCQTQV